MDLLDSHSIELHFHYYCVLQRNLELLSLMLILPISGMTKIVITLCNKDRLPRTLAGVRGAFRFSRSSSKDSVNDIKRSGFVNRRVGLT